ncbi:MAG TPA: FixH family protein [Sphingomonadaceae bacterium]|nr:FixH family protein [Sphingomonadaceae bacterium]
MGRLDDVALTFIRQADGSYLSQETLPEGRWTLRLAAKAGPDSWRGEEVLK